MYLVNIVPAVVLLGLETLQAERRRNRLLLAASTGLLFGLLAFSAFYIAWFGAVVAAMVIVGIGIATSLDGGAAALGAAVRSRARELVALAAGFGVAMIPFVATYLPVLDQTGGRTYAEVSNLAPLRGDLINVGRHNLVWGWIVTPLLDGDVRLDTLARAVAPTPTVLMLVVVAGWSLWRRRRRGDRSLADTIGATAAIVVLIVWVLPVRFRVGSVWYLLYRFVPGGSAIRVPGRIEVLNSWLAVVAIGCWLAARDRSVGAERESERRRWQAWVLPVLLCLAATEQLNTTIGYRRFDRSDELAALSAVPPAPAACTAFAVTDPTRTEYDGVSIDAMLIAHEVGLPTVNGYSGQVPEGWTLRPWEDDYEASVTAWAVEHGLSLCSYNLATHVWSITATPQR
jgi:MFS family permease